MGLSHSPRIVTDGLVLCLDAANRRSTQNFTTWYDLSTNSYSSTLYNLVGINSLGGGFYFNGVDSRVDLGNILNFGTGSFSIEVLFNRKDDSPTDQYGGSLISKGSFTGGISGYSINITDTTYTSSFHFQTRKGGPLGNGSDDITQSVAATFYPTNDTWYHVIAVRNRSIAKLLLYINGSLNNSNDELTETNLNSTNKLFIGSLDSSGSVVRQFNGRVAVVRIYNRALSSQEVLQNYASVRGRFR